MAGIFRSSAVRSVARRITDVAARRPFAAAAALIEDDPGYWTEHDQAHVPLAKDTCGEREERGVQWVFMGGPGAQKHVYAARMAQLLDVPYISMGTLVRQELKPRSSLYIKIANSVNEGKPLPEDIIFGLLSKRLEERYYRGETGFILDGIPRTQLQAEILDQIVEIDLVVNFKSSEESLNKKQIGTDICLQSSPFVVEMEDSRLEKIRLYSEQSKLMEDYYRKQRKLLNIQVSGGPGEMWQGLLAALQLQHIDTATSPHKLTV